MTHEENLESQAAKTLIGAKRAADGFDTGIWELPSGKFIALPRGIVVPKGSVRVASRHHARAQWQAVSVDEYDTAQEEALHHC